MANVYAVVNTDVIWHLKKAREREYVNS